MKQQHSSTKSRNYYGKFSLTEMDEDESVLFEGSPLHQSLVDSGIPLCDVEVEERSTERTKGPSSGISEKEEAAGFLKWIVVRLQCVWKLFTNLVFPWKSKSVEDEHNRAMVYVLLKARVLDYDDQDFLENFLEEIPEPPQSEAEQLISWKSKLEIIQLHAKSQLSFLTWMKKCLRLIQETELVARGFTLVSQKSPISLIEQSHLSGNTTRQCPELRKLLFHTARDGIIVCRETTKQIVMHFPISPELDAERGHLAFQALESYGPCLQTSANEATELYNLTDGFSVAALKGMVHLCHLHQSEFIKRLVLLFGHSYRGKTDLVSSQFQKEIMTLTRQLQDWTQVLDKSYSYHKSYLLNREPKDKVMDQSSPCRDIVVAVHSLDLHLQAALTRVRALSAWLEKLEEESQSVDSDFLSHDTVAQMMQPIKAELDSCKGCWEEGTSRIDRLQKRKPNTELDKGTAERNTDVPMSKVDSKNVVKVEDPIIIDQVFEAYTDEDHVEQRDYSWEQPLTVEEKEKKKREKEEALRMLKELKSVISVRSTEMEKREADALKRYRNQTDQDTESNIQTEKRKKSAPLDLSDASGNLPPIADEKTIDVFSSQQTDDKFGECPDSDKVDNSITNATDIDITDSNKVLVSTIENIVATEDRTVEMDKLIHDRYQTGQLDNLSGQENFHDSMEDKSSSFVKEASGKNSDSLDKTSISDSSDFLNISGGTSQKSLKLTSLRDSEPDIQMDDKQLTSSEKSSSFMEISNTDVDSVISAISYDNENMDNFDQIENSAYESFSENDHHEKGLSGAFEHELRTENENIDKNDAITEKDNPLTLEERLNVIHGANLSFTSNVAALAVAKSHAYGLVKETTFGADTFGDDSDEIDNDESDGEQM